MWPALVGLGFGILLSQHTVLRHAGRPKPGYHDADWEPEYNAESQDFADTICGEETSSAACTRYAYILRECYPKCGQLLAGYNQMEWERCVTDCVVRPSCKEMCVAGTHDCAAKCYQNYQPMVKDLEKVWKRYHHGGVHPGTLPEDERGVLTYYVEEYDEEEAAAVEDDGGAVTSEAYYY
jgi:hypothetical protein